MPVLDTASSLPPAQRLMWLYELTWRYELCLMPLWDAYAKKLEEAIALISPFPDLVGHSPAKLSPTIDNRDELNWRELSEAWIALTLSLVRYRRENSELEQFEKVSTSTALLVGRYEEIGSFLAYQRCLLGLEQLDHVRVRQTLAEWDRISPSDAFWVVRRAAVRAEVGDSEKAEKEAEAALRAIRDQTNYDADGACANDVHALSREGWAMMVLAGVQIGRRLLTTDQRPNYRGRWEDLNAQRCNPWTELERFELLLAGSPPESPEAKNRRSRNRGQLFLSSEGTLARLQPALQAARFLEEVGYPIRSQNVSLGAELLRRAAAWLRSELPERALTLLLRLREDDPIKEFLSDHRVATLAIKDVERASAISEGTLDQAVPALLSTDRMRERGAYDAALQSIKTALHILMALVPRLPQIRRDRVVSRALDLRHHIRLAAEHTIWPVLYELATRALSGMTPSEIAHHALSVISQPLLDVDFKTPIGSWNEDVIWTLMHAGMKPERYSAPALWDDAINRLLRFIAEGPDSARAQATMRCAVLHHIGVLSAEETDRLLELIWDSDPANASVPTLVSLLPGWTTLLLPQPQPGAALAAYKANVLVAPLGSFKTTVDMPDGTKRPGWSSHATDKMLLDALSTTMKPWENATNRFLPSVEWSPSEVARFIDVIHEWWQNEGRELAQRTYGATENLFTVFRPHGRFDRILELLSYVALPVLPPDHPAALKAALVVQHLLKAEVPAESALPLVVRTDRSALDKAASLLRRSITSPETDRAEAAIEGAYVWVDAAARDLVPPPPTDLMGEVGSIVRSRRGPALSQALLFAARHLAFSKLDDASVLVDDVKAGLEYLVSETQYVSPSDFVSLFSYDEVPRIRATSAYLVGVLYQRIGPDDPTVRLWVDAMVSEPLTSVQRSFDNGVKLVQT